MKTFQFLTFLAIALAVVIANTDGKPAGMNQSSPMVQPMNEETVQASLGLAEKAFNKTKEIDESNEKKETTPKTDEVVTVMTATEMKTLMTTLPSSTDIPKAETSTHKGFIEVGDETKAGSAWIITLGLVVFVLVAVSSIAAYIYLKR